MVSSSCEWKSKDLAIAQSTQGKQAVKEERVNLLSMSLRRSPAEGVAQIKGVWCATMPGSGACFVPDDLELKRSPCLNLLGFIATMPQETCISQPLRITGEPSSSGL